MELHAVAVARQGDIGCLAVQPRRRQHMGAVHRDALRLVDGRGIAMVDAVIILEVEGDGSAVSVARSWMWRSTCSMVAERAVLHAEAAVVLQEHDAVAAGEVRAPRSTVTRRPRPAPRLPASVRGPPH